MEEFRFGLFADIQYADRPLRIGRYYRSAGRKAQTCVDAFNAADVDFCVHMGDLIDCPNEPEEGRRALATMVPILRSFRGRMICLLGNHDVDSVPYSELAKTLELPEPRWYSFDHKGLHFVVLDCNYDADEVAYQPGTTYWDQCYLPRAELDWLQKDLTEAGAETVVVMVHALLDDMDNPHVIRNAAAARKILETCGKKVVVLQGHMHCGHESETSGIGYHTMPSIVNGRTRTCYWIVDVQKDGIFVEIHDSTRNHGKPVRKQILSL